MNDIQIIVGGWDVGVRVFNINLQGERSYLFSVKYIIEDKSYELLPGEDI